MSRESHKSMISEQDMAENCLCSPALNSDVQQSSRTAYIGPTNVKNGDTNYHAFARDSEDLDLPSRIMKSNWSNRLSTVSDIERILKQPSTTVLNENLKAAVDLIATSIGDSQLKVSQKGLKLMQQLIILVRERIVLFVPSLTILFLVKMGTNKGDLKRTGMHLFKILMEVVGPMKVMNEVASSGLRYKTSRVCEEAINVIISVLILYDNSGLQLLPVAKNLVPCLADGKSRVRQAAFEAIALLTTKLVDSEFSQVVAMIRDLHKTNECMPQGELCGLNIMDAYHARLERHSLPTLDDHGLVKYAILALSPGSAGGQGTPIHSGPDIDWIMAETVPVPTHYQPSFESSSPTQNDEAQEQTFRPYRSAGKRPWEVNTKTEVATIISPAPTVEPSALPPPKFQPLAPSLTNAASSRSSSKKLPANSYREIHLSKLARSNPLPTLQNQNHTPAMTTGCHKHTLGSLKPPRAGKMVEKSFFAHAASVSNRDSQQGSASRQDSFPMPTSLGDGGLQIISSSVSDEKFGLTMSMTWPRANLSLGRSTSPGMRSVPPMLSTRSSAAGMSSVLPLKGPVQINADDLLVADVHNVVPTNFSRPLSKPRVRNPLSSLKLPSQCPAISPNPSSIPSIGTGSNQTENPTRVEQDFLMSGGYSNPSPAQWVENSFDEDYFFIPEDNALLNCSLSSSLSSLCNHKDFDGDVDKFRHIHREAASRKAQILSRAASATSSPEFRHHSTKSFGHTTDNTLAEPESPPKKISSPLTSKNLTMQQHVKCPALAQIESKTTQKLSVLDSDRVYGVGSVKEEKTYSLAFAKKHYMTTKMSGPAKRERLIAQQKSGATSSSEEIDASLITINNISLEGRCIDREVGGASREAQPHGKKNKKADLHQTPSKSRVTISSSLFGFHEGVGERRPSIERGGTNTISMEVSGIGSWNGIENNRGQQTSQQLSQSTKESILQRKLKQEMVDDDFEVTEKKSHSATYSTTKKSSQVLPVLHGDQVEGASTSTTANCSIASAPVETTHKRNRKKRTVSDFSPAQTLSPHKQRSDALPKNRSQSYNKNTLTVTDMDLQCSGRGGSPQEPDQALLESHVHANPDQAAKTALQSLVSDDWSNKCEGIGMIICISHCYPSLLRAQLHTILSAVQKEVKNLRSSVSKKAVECLAHLFSSMKRAMETDLDQVVLTLFQKGGESNAFLREAVEKCLAEMVANVSPQKALVALISGGLVHRNAQVRKMTSKYICMTIETYEPSKFLHSSKDLLEKTLPAIVQLTKDHSPDPRFYARKCLNMLWPEPDFQQIVARVLKNHQYTEAREAVEALKVKGVGDPPSEYKSQSGGSSSTTSSRRLTGGSTCVSMQVSSTRQDSLQEVRRYTLPSNMISLSSPLSAEALGVSKKRHVPEVPQEVPLPDGLLERLQASSWNERHEAISDLEIYIINSRPQTLSSQLHRIFDVFTSRLTDRNSKVNLHALQAFVNMVPVLHSALVPIIHNILSALIPNLASRNLTIHSTAMTVLDLLSQHIEAVHLVPTVANSSQFGNARIQPIMTKILSNLTLPAYMQKPQLVTRLVLPVVWHHVSARTSITGEAKLALHELCKVLHECMGQGFLDNASQLSEANHKKLKELLDWDGSYR